MDVIHYFNKFNLRNLEIYNSTITVMPTSLLLYDKLTIFFETIDSYIIKLWCIYVVCWWWAIVSWSGLKLFRHSKGIQG